MEDNKQMEAREGSCFLEPQMSVEDRLVTGSVTDKSIVREEKRLSLILILLIY